MTLCTCCLSRKSPRRKLGGGFGFIQLVDGILSAKAADAEADTTALEEEIDRLVYKLYGLTDEEIAVVEAGGL